MLTMVHQPRYGLEIIYMISAASQNRFEINFGTLYPKLRSLERRRLIQSIKMEDVKYIEQRGGHRRKYYELTPEGRHALHEASQLRQTLLNWDDGLQPFP